MMTCDVEVTLAGDTLVLKTEDIPTAHVGGVREARPHGVDHRRGGGGHPPGASS